MAFLNLSTYGDVPVDLDAGSAQMDDIEIGTRRRAFGGVMHSAVRARLRRWRVRLMRVPAATGEAILAALRGASPTDWSGDLIANSGTSPASCYATDVRVSGHPKHADGEYMLIEFVLEEEGA